MKKNDYKKRIIENIKKGKIEQKSKWYFLTKSYIFWTLFFLSTIMGSLAVSSIIFQINENRKIFLEAQVDNLFFGFSEILPYFWIILFFIFLVLAYINYKKTYNSYKNKNLYIILFSLIASLILGFMIYRLGVTKILEEKYQEYIPYYKQYILKQRRGIGKFLKMHGYRKMDFNDPVKKSEMLNLIEKYKE